MTDDDDLMTDDIREHIRKEVEAEMAKPTPGGELEPLAKAICEVGERFDMDGMVRETPGLYHDDGPALVRAARKFLGRKGS